MDEDRRLLHGYVSEHSQDAFASLVRRHVDWVYSCALRRVGDAHLAEDVTQAVFILLGQKAGTIGVGVSVTGWLFRAADFAARDALRAQNRRRIHERRAMAMSPMQSSMDQRDDWEEIRPVLDSAVAEGSGCGAAAVLSGAQPC